MLLIKQVTRSGQGAPLILFTVQQFSGAGGVPAEPYAWDTGKKIHSSSEGVGCQSQNVPPFTIQGEGSAPRTLLGPVLVVLH